MAGIEGTKPKPKGEPTLAEEFGIKVTGLTPELAKEMGLDKKTTMEIMGIVQAYLADIVIKNTPPDSTERHLLKMMGAYTVDMLEATDRVKEAGEFMRSFAEFFMGAQSPEARDEIVEKMELFRNVDTKVAH